MKKVITGQAKYVNKKASELILKGYVIVKMHNHPNGEKTLMLEKI